ncbi:MAG: hypothetical protein GX352_00330 [Clostridiales bacterium]|nr:hypothetical protein [Clostridiales bacterium]
MKIRKIIASMLTFVLLLMVGLTACSTPKDSDNGDVPGEANSIESEDSGDITDTEADEVEDGVDVSDHETDSGAENDELGDDSDTEALDSDLIDNNTEEHGD